MARRPISYEMIDLDILTVLHALLARTAHCCDPAATATRGTANPATTPTTPRGSISFRFSGVATQYQVSVSPERLGSSKNSSNRSSKARDSCRVATVAEQSEGCRNDLLQARDYR